MSAISCSLFVGRHVVVGEDKKEKNVDGASVWVLLYVDRSPRERSGRCQYMEYLRIRAPRAIGSDPFKESPVKAIIGRLPTHDQDLCHSLEFGI